ncbi:MULTISPECIES: flagella synthesis protein FlgN [Shewanella]|uniref:flagella synthesis protein FlgN n=1 Tax=Shewanella TaxID=22 RepID=UPI001EBC0F40|nr:MULTISPECIES: flagellar protein FlgN [Shewanella]MBZ4680479.1 flagellar biosynthesis protein FlgN [Shewanella sp.]
MPDTPDITSLIAQQMTQLERLLNLIEQEKNALLDRNADNLLQLAQDKSDLLNEVKAVDEALSSHPELAKLSQSPLAEQVSEARELLATCQLRNQENAGLIELSMASINRLAQALQVSRNASSLTYDGKGKTSTIATLGNDLKA